ncbi:protein mono-ADP-ribosyltransferase PARP14-like [Physella acuta]|uniref:protein mono-ADP-ribosyltransferase PARP14-like n=1 Tax=Physella acuta TaxID=109671 RepID=UPI0027DB2C9F|nr:protein mono-ADP-ribosyltransferase PARP14-like [Physella acuta]
MDENTRELRVFDLPPDVTEDQLMTIFRNKRGQGGGPIEKIILENKTNSAIITFKDAEAVDLIMGRPSQVVNILGKDSRVERFFKAPETPVNKPCAEVHKKKKSKPKPPQQQTKPSDEPKPQEERQTDFCENTVKMFVLDITKTKDFYLLYLEDESINSGPFIEESLLLDGHNKSVYVTFHHKKDAEKFCSVKHKPKDSNIQKVQLAEPADFNTYNNLLYIRGVNDDFDVKRLRALISEACAMEVNDVIQQQDTRAAIFVFDSEECTDISELTWQCSRLLEEPYITGPVFQEFCVLVSDLKPETAPDLLRRYMSNKNRSGGGSVKSVHKLNPSKAIVAFIEEIDYECVLSKTDHSLEGCAISVQQYYPCLNKEEIQPQKNQPNKPTAIAHPLQSIPSRVHHSGIQKYMTENLSGQEVQLVTFKNVKNIKKSYCGILDLIFEALQFLKKYQDRMEQVARDSHCKMELKPFKNRTQLMLWLDWPNKITAQEVKQKLEQAIGVMVNFLSKFRAVTFKIPQDKIQDFQNFFRHPETSHYNIYFHHVSFVALIIGEDTVSNLIALVNENYSQFLSQPMNLGAINYASPQSAHQSDHELPYANKNKPTEIPKETLPDKELTEVKDMPFKRDEFILIKKSNFFLPTREKYPNLKIEYDEKEFKVFFKGRDKTDVISACYESLKKCQDDLAKVKLENFSAEQNLLLQKATFLEKVNSSLHEGHLYFSPDGVLTLQYINTADKDKMIEQIKSQVDVRKIKVNKDLVLVLKSQLGANFLSGLCDQIDGVQMTACIQLDQAEENLVIISPQDQQYKLHKEVEEFLKKNQPDRKEIAFSYGKQQMLKRFMQNNLDQIFNDKTAKVEKLADRFIVTGLKDSVNKLNEQLQLLSEKITFQEIQVKYFGIQEFLENADGKSLVKKVEDQNQCVILIKSEDVKAAFGSPKTETKQVEPSVIARAEVNNVELVFLQGDITTIKADVIVNPLDSSLATSSALSRSLISRGGADVFKDLTQSRKMSLGTVIPTTGGQIPNLKAIFNVVCPVSTDDDEDVDKLRLAVANCLMECKKQNFNSIALPVVGTGQILNFPVLSACVRMMDALYNYLNGSPTLTHIYLCDIQPNHVEELMDRFKAKFDQCPLQHVSKLAPLPKFSLGSYQETSYRKQAPEAPKHFKKQESVLNLKNIKVNFVTGEINKQQTDVIVVTVDRHLDLSKGRLAKTILEEGGPSIQQELQSNYPDGIKFNDFAESSGGNLRCGNIFHAALSRFKGNNKELEALVVKLLEGAEKIQASSISIPALGTGNLGYPADLSASVISEAIRKFSKTSASSLKQINIVVYPRDQEVVKVFRSVLEGKEDEQGASFSTFHKAAFRSDHFGRDESKNIKKYGAVTLVIKKGDITQAKCEGIVNGIKDSMDLTNSGQVCKALLKLCGQTLQDECSNKQSEMAKDGVVLTSAPNMSCQHILHVSQDKFAKHWDKGVTAVLAEADKAGLKSLAIPALGAGTRNANIPLLKKMILGAIKDFSKNSPRSLTLINLVIYDQHVLDEFLEQAQSKHLSHNTEGSGTTTKVSEQVTLKCYSNRATQIRMAEQSLLQECKAAFKENSVREENVKKLDKSQIEKLKSVGYENLVQVSVKPEAGIILMQGFKVDGMLKVQQVLQNFLVKAVDEHHKQLHRHMPSAIQWQYEKGRKWTDFEPILNSELERKYQKKASHHDITDAKGRKYRVDLTAMKEFYIDDIDNSVDSRHGINIRRKDRTKGGEPLPEKWTPMADDENVKIVPLKQGSQEYTKIQQFFLQGGANASIKKIERIQNKALYQQYSVKKRELELHNPKGHKNELRLFHGTSANTIQMIINNGFNRSYCGVNGTAYGKGVYFAVQSSYSVNYAAPDAQGNRHMFVVRVLVGESTPSNSSMNFLPNKPGTTRPYDSGSANGIYVIFYDTQCYPEYMITF